MGNHLARHTTRRSKHQAHAQKMCDDFMNTYDSSKTGALNRDEVKALATDLCNKFTPLVGGITDEDVDMIMRCGGEDTKAELTSKDLPLALAVMMAVRDDSQNFHELFLKHDTDRSGYLPFDQLTALLTEVNDGAVPSPSEVQYILRQCEPRGREDPISESQLKAAIACWYCLAEPAHQRIKAMFQTWDTEGTGVISKAELAAVMNRLSPEPVTEAEVDILFRSIDTHHTGSIEYDEFVEWVLGGGCPIMDGAEEESRVPDKPEKIKWSTGWMKNR